ncbi:uncharacterized protein [Narcine bancroftii]|uniref:uncharacterized protein n=1 Tax=Narcine bancroftii TaxID=1343680 RepID=UPI0038311FEB
MAPRKASKWSEEEVRLLLDLLTQESQEKELTGTVRDGPAFEWLSGVLAAQGHQRSKNQVVMKLKSMRMKFHAVLDHNRTSGNGRKEWQYFDQCHTLWGASCSATPLNVASALETPESPELIPEGPQGSHSSNGGGLLAQEEEATAEDTDLDAPERGSAEVTIPGSGEATLSTENTASGARCKHQRLSKGQVLAKELQVMMLALDREDSERDRQRSEEVLDHERVVLADQREDEEATRRSEVEKLAQSMSEFAASLRELSAAMDRQSVIFNRLVMRLEASPSPVPQSYGQSHPMYLAPPSSMPFYSTPMHHSSGRFGMTEMLGSGTGSSFPPPTHSSHCWNEVCVGIYY